MDVKEKERKIRDLINNPRIKSSLLSKTAAWNRLCSSLDVIGDTELAINAYPSVCSNSDDGKSYIIIYGMLQTLFTQQDAVKHICSVLDVKFKLPSELQDIREIRSSTVGHPALQKEDGVSKSNFIQRSSLKPDGFDLMTVYSDSQDYQIRYVSIPKLIKIQNEYIGKILDQILQELETEEVKHRETHKDTKVRDFFPQTLSYNFQKLFEASVSGQAFSLGFTNLKIIEDCLNKFKSELEARGEWGIYDSIDYHMELISYPLEQLKQYFSAHEESKLNEKDAYIFTSFMSDQIEILKKIAEEIDEDYTSNPQG